MDLLFQLFMNNIQIMGKTTDKGGIYGYSSKNIFNAYHYWSD